MTAVRSALFDLNVLGKRIGALEIAVLDSLPRVMGREVLLDFRGDDPGDGLEPVQLIESAEYRFQLHVPVGKVLRIEPREVFDFDDASMLRGRIRTRQWTGRMEIAVEHETGAAAPVALEVRSVKLDYHADYRRMMESIAGTCSELVLQRFAAAAQRITVDDARDARTLYQRFAFLSSLLQSDELETALRHVFELPYVAWDERDEEVSPLRGVRGNSSLIRNIVAAGPRIAAGDLPSISTLPSRLRVSQPSETLDNVPNRFVKHALRQWADLVSAVAARLEDERHAAVSKGEAPAAPIMRGLAEATKIQQYFEAKLSSPMFDEVGDLTVFPEANQVLEKRHGYREILRLFLSIEFGSALAWTGGEETYSAGQRDVATLYEYWVFFEIARVVADICNGLKPDLSAMIRESGAGLGLTLARGEAQGVRGTVTRRGRTFDLAFWFNQEFAPEGEFRSWTTRMRPDCSLRISLRPPLGGSNPGENAVYLHFDAKYRVASADQVFSTDSPVLGPKNTDLLKMHAYRDAIFGAAGAYVIFPGTSSTPPVRKRGEVLPSVGAFAFRPSPEGAPEGAQALTQFLGDVIDALAEQASQYERARYWENVAYSDPGSRTTKVPWWPLLAGPVADVRVLVVPIQDTAEANWIRTRREVPLRTRTPQGEVLAVWQSSASLLVLFAPDGTSVFQVNGNFEVASANDLHSRGWPAACDAPFVILKINEVEQPGWLKGVDLGVLAGACGFSTPPTAPFVATWRDVCVAAGDGP